MSREGREYPQRPLVGIGIAVLRREPFPTVLLIRRGRPPAEGQWSLPGGAQRLGETSEAAARRELAEETGITCGVLHLAGHMDSIHRDEEGRIRFHYTILDFCGLWEGGDAQAGGDADAVEWAAFGDLDRYGLTDGFLRILEESRRILAV